MNTKMKLTTLKTTTKEEKYSGMFDDIQDAQVVDEMRVKVKDTKPEDTKTYRKICQNKF